MNKRFTSAQHSARTKQKRRTNKASQPLGPVDLFTVDGLTHEGKGVARKAGKVTFIAGALPTETVKAQVFKSNRRFDEAKLIAIEQASSHREHPPCTHFEKCGGCSFQHLAIDEQRQAKKRWLQGQLRKVCAPEAITMLVDTPLAYRRRARLAVHFVSGKLQMGFRGEASKQIIAIDNCIVLT